LPFIDRELFCCMRLSAQLQSSESCMQASIPQMEFQASFCIVMAVHFLKREILVGFTHMSKYSNLVRHTLKLTSCLCANFYVILVGEMFKHVFFFELRIYAPKFSETFRRSTNFFLSSVSLKYAKALRYRQ